MAGLFTFNLVCFSLRLLKDVIIILFLLIDYLLGGVSSIYLSGLLILSLETISCFSAILLSSDP